MKANRSLSIYNYLDKYVIVPHYKYKSGMVFSSKIFIVSEDNINEIELWDLIKKGLSKYERLTHEYDGNNPSSKNFNAELSKSAGASSYKKFWQNSQFMNFIEKDDKLVFSAVNREPKRGYQGSFKREEWDKDSGLEISKRILEVFKLMNSL